MYAEVEKQEMNGVESKLEGVFFVNSFLFFSNFPLFLE